MGNAHQFHFSLALLLWSGLRSPKLGAHSTPYILKLMKTESKNIKALYAPRSLAIFLVQYFAFVPIITAVTAFLAICIKEISNPPRINYSDLSVFFGIFALPLLIIGFFMLYYPQKYRTRIVFDSERQTIKKLKEGIDPQEFNLNEAKLIISKTIKTLPGCKFYLAIEDHQGNTKNIFEEDTFMGGKNWEAFAKKVSEMTNLALKQEYYLEQMDGHLLKKSLSERTKDKRQGLIILLVPLIISLIGAGIYRSYGTSRAFLAAGVVTVGINILLSFIYVFIYRGRMGFVDKNNFILIIYILTLVIPYSLFYLFSIHVLNGFQWPLGN